LPPFPAGVAASLPGLSLPLHPPPAHAAAAAISSAGSAIESLGDDDIRAITGPVERVRRR
jgi:hypothetical protein